VSLNKTVVDLSDLSTANLMYVSWWVVRRTMCIL